MKLLTFICLVFVLNFSSVINAQDIEWSDSEKKEQKTFFSFFYAKEKEFFALSEGLVGEATTIQHYSNLKIDAEQKVELKVEVGKRLDRHTVKVSNDKLVIFGFNSGKEENTLYYQIFDQSCIAMEAPVLVASVKSTKVKNDQDETWHFSVAQSEDKNYIVVSYFIHRKADEKEKIGYKVFNKEMNLVKEGIYESQYLEPEIALNALVISDKMELALGFTLLKKKANQEFYRKSGYMVHFIKENEEFDTDLSLDENASNGWISLNMDNSKNNLVIVGGYTEKELNTEVYLIKVNIDDRIKTNTVLSRFTREFILQGLNEKELKSITKLESKDKTSEYLDGFELRKIEILPDGGVVGVLENHHLFNIRMMDGATVYYKTSQHYYDILIFRFNETEGFDWVQKVVKRQISFDDSNPYFNGFAGYRTGTEMVFFFNDNIKNYEQNGDFKFAGSELYGIEPSSGKCAIANVHVNLENGEITRKVLTTAQEADAHFIARRFMNDKLNHTAILYFETRFKEKFGFIRY